MPRNFEGKNPRLSTLPMNPVTKILNAILTTFCPKNGQEHSSEFIKQLLYFAPSTC